MKKYWLLFLMITTAIGTYGQVFNTGQTLKKGVISLGVEPMFRMRGGINNPTVYGHAGYGLTSGIDFAVKVGVGNAGVGKTGIVKTGNRRYIGADIEFALAKRMSLSFGAHHSGDFGLDGTFLFDIPIKQVHCIYLGVDSDTNFREKINESGEKVNDLRVLVWVPIGVEIEINKSFHFLFESLIAVSPDAYHIIGAGVNYYF